MTLAQPARHVQATSQRCDPTHWEADIRPAVLFLAVILGISNSSQGQLDAPKIYRKFREDGMRAGKFLVFGGASTIFYMI